MLKIDEGYKKLEDANAATQSDLDATKQDLSGSKTDINDVKADVQALEAQDITLGNRLTVLEGNYDTIHHEVATLADSVEILQDGHIYSTDEKVIGKWVDGKNIYERTITNGQLTLDSTNHKKTWSLQLPSDIEVISCKGYFLTNDNNRFIFLSSGITTDSTSNIVPQFSSGILKNTLSTRCYVTFNDNVVTTEVTKIVITIEYIK